VSTSQSGAPVRASFAGGAVSARASASPRMSALLAQRSAREDWPALLSGALSVVLGWPAPACVWWGDARVPWFNDAFLERFVTRDAPTLPAALGAPGAVLVPALLAALEPELQQARSEARSGSAVLQLPAHGGRGTFRVHASPLVALDGTVHGVYTTFEADEARRASPSAEERLRMSEERLRLAQQCADAGTWDWDIISDTDSWSEEYFELYGLDPRTTEPSFEAWLGAIHVDDRAEAQRLADEALERGTDMYLELRVLHPKRGLRWLAELGRTIRDEDGRALRMAGIAIDVTERKHVEEALRRSQRELADFFENATVGLHWMGPDGRILWVNRAELELLGCSHEEYVGHHISEFYADKHVADDLLARLFAGETFKNLEVRLRCKDGTIKDALVDLSVRWENGKFMHTRCFTRDISEAKRAGESLVATNRALQRSNEDLNQFAYAASHDLREPLRMVAIYAQLLQRRYGEKMDADADLYIRYVVDGALRMEQLLRDLLVYSQAGSEAERPDAPCRLVPILQAALQNLESTIKQNEAEVSWSALPALRVHDIHLLSVFQNLIGNAIKYRSSDPPRIHVGAERIGEEWVLSVSDNGIGIEPRYHQQVFGVFKRLHGAKYPGTGIGLAICAKIVQRYSGRIWIESEPGRGSVVRVALPV
jgi:PAS domain S-box-containing protein